MSSQQRILASRANGARSRGPVTAAGKSRSSRNATRHGLLSDIVVLDNESPEAFQELLARHIERFAPADDVGLGIVEEMAAAFWRLRRAWAIETSTLDKGLLEQTGADEAARIAAAFTDAAAAPKLALLHRYETRLHRIYQRALRNAVKLPSPAGPPEAASSGPPHLPAKIEICGTNLEVQ